MPFKECFINDETCASKIKKAHILSLSATMKMICGQTKAGLQVVQLGNIQDGKLIPSRIGWSIASAHHCFCHDHDNDLFEPIENDNILDSKNKQQLFLHILRSFAYVYYRKKESIIGLESLIEPLTEVGESLQKLQETLLQFVNLPGNGKKWTTEDELRKRLNLSIWTYEFVRKQLLEINESGDYSRIIYRSAVIDKRLPFASAGVFFPEIVDPENKIPSIVSFSEGDPVLKRPAIMLNVLPDKHGRTIIVAGALKEDTNAVLTLRRFNHLEKGTFGRALTSMILSANPDNTFFHPQFWEYLKSNGESKTLIEELNQKRGLDILTHPLKLSELDLFSKKYSCDNLGIEFNQ